MTDINEDTPLSDASENSVDCGIIMPIAAMPDYEATHWSAMLELTSRAIRSAGMVPVPVWQGGAADVLQERIVRNLYELPFAVCDISGANSNVMLELGLRLAFGKPTIIINDELVRAPFDIGAIEYVPYDRALHFLKAENFLERLREKIEWTRSRKDEGSYRPYIKTFGPIEAGTPGEEAIPLGRAILDQVEQLGAAVRNLQRADMSAAGHAGALIADFAGRSSKTGAKITVAKRQIEESRRVEESVTYAVPNANDPMLQAEIGSLPCVKSMVVEGPQELRVELDGPRFECDLTLRVIGDRILTARKLAAAGMG